MGYKFFGVQYGEELSAYFPIQKIENPLLSGISADWATNSQQD